MICRCRLLRLLRLGGGCSTVHKSTGSDRRAELSGLRCDIEGASFLIEAGEAARAVEDGEQAVGIFVHAHGGADVVMAVALGWNLQGAPVVGDAIVAADDPILPDAEHLLELAAALADKSLAALAL